MRETTTQVTNRVHVGCKSKLRQQFHTQRIFFHKVDESHKSLHWIFVQFCPQFIPAKVSWDIHFKSSKSFFNFMFGFVSFLFFLSSFLDSNGFLSLFHTSCIGFHKSFGGFRNSYPFDESELLFVPLRSSRRPSSCDSAVSFSSREPYM